MSTRSMGISSLSATLCESFFRQEYTCEFPQSSEVPLQLPLLRSAISDEISPLYLDWEPESPFHTSRRRSPPPMPLTGATTPADSNGAIYQTGERSAVDFTRQKLRRASIRTLILDATSVGKPVLDNFKRINKDTAIVPITVTGAEIPSRDETGWRVPVRDLVTNLALWLERPAQS